MKTILYFPIIAIFFLQSCNNNDQAYDATGIFESDAVIVSAQAAGQILAFKVEEGMRLKAGQAVGQIDPTTLQLQKAQVQAGIGAIGQKRFVADPQVAVLEKQILVQNNQLAAQQEQMKTILKEENRLQNLVNANAIPSKQLDDLQGKKAVLEKQIAGTTQLIAVTKQQIIAQKQTVGLKNKGLFSEKDPLEKQIALLDEQINRCVITNPVKGTVLLTYTNAFEMAGPGKALYKIAPLDTLILRAYISGEQLPDIAINQDVSVLIDRGAEPDDQYNGRITWIADEAEFTPKTIQTKEERANLVYAIKVAVPNAEGKLKIGMYAEVDW